MSYKLNAQQHQVLLAANGIEGVNLARAECPDLILMDLRLPLLDGLQATAQIKACVTTSHIPIIALTAQGTHAIQEQCKLLGCVEFMSKPVNFERLLNTINHFTQNYITA
jgi:CheY-like chemotaxis protein